MHIRATRSEDFPTLFDLRARTRENAMSVAELAARGITPDSAAEALHTGLVRGWLCEVDGQIVGFASGDRDGGEMLVLAVLPEYEGRGIGRALLAKVTAWPAECGHQRIWLSANPDSAVRAYGFYRHCGWVATGELVDGEEIMVYQPAG
ncbi:N-acetylglutamate synthase, GNAT family [Andreprevotia lacus DSM 23236]|jgi:ribosomal protein S18 acetylase RimI-like enzyme|uniref:N-acetylglutamate synthase, GNAT family n=1 Tax=Andreprevotia lacus DSM 23236 TaxID=1121001 RepID=A0A1W1XIY1_9NEIS|nr:GNAT family N-acetyltransferase [Andreprevotia lacus]SMC23481.1 N-acetylglutamate synthase, GNAT family [Andreprevotia lacus DSM 23236]